MIIAASFDINDPESWLNRALQYGDGLFETMRMTQGRIPLWEFHMKRLKQGMKKLGMKLIDSTELNRSIESNCPSEYASCCVVKLIVFRAMEGRTYQPHSNQFEWLISVNRTDPVQVNEPVTLAVAEQRISKQTALAGIKHLNRLEQVLLASELNSYQGISDLLVLNNKNKIIETTCQNVVMIKNNQLYTPQLKHSGVRGVALDWLKSYMEVKHGSFKLSELECCDGLLTSNSIKGFSLVSSVKNKCAKDSISFSNSHPIHDKIVKRWTALFNS